MVKLAEKERDSLEVCRCYCISLHHLMFNVSAHIFFATGCEE
jgi:hypothetical protein